MIVFYQAALKDEMNESWDSSGSCLASLARSPPADSKHLLYARPRQRRKLSAEMDNGRQLQWLLFYMWGSEAWRREFRYRHNRYDSVFVSDCCCANCHRLRD